MLDSLLGRPGTPTDRALNLLADACVRRGISADTMTYAALALGITAGVLFAVGWMWTALLAVALSGAADAVDGRVARRGSGNTAWGGVMDLTFDRIVEAAALLGAALPRPQWHAPALVLVATWYVNLCVFLAIGALSDRSGVKVIHYAPGLLERTELIVLALVVVLLPAWLPAAAYTYAGLVSITAAQRFLYARRILAAAP